MKNYWEELKKLYKSTGLYKYSIITACILLIIDDLNLFTKITTSKVNTILFIMVVILCIIKIIELNPLNMFKLNIVNDLDVILIYLALTDVIFVFSSIYIISEITYRFYMGTLIFVMLIVMLIYRIKKINRSYEGYRNKSNTYDLKELYEGSIENTGNMILINEQEVSYDLLKRDDCIEKLYDTIVNCNPDKKFTISLEGSWGSGKTTILNIVKNKIRENNNEIVVIDSFDPWSYNDESSMFRAMFDIILKESGINYSLSESKRFTDNLYGALFENKLNKKIKVLDIYNNDKLGDLNKIKEFIHGYLRKTNKRIVFIIDNIDRIEKDKVILLFKLVGNILNFDYITYILSFDDERVKKIMENELSIDYDYLKKVIQLQIKVPAIDKDVKKDVIKKCINNVIILYEEDEKSSNENDKLINYIVDVIDDIRDLKRFINSVLTSYHKKNKYLYSVDFLVIELIKIYNSSLYYSIIKNREYFISEDKMFFSDLFAIGFNKDKFNSDAKVYFDELFKEEDNKKYIHILAEVFPYVNLYKNDKNLEQNNSTIVDSRGEKNKDILKNRRAYSAKYFELYFTKSSNDFSKISDLIEEFIKNINENGYEGIKKLVYETMYDLPKLYHKITFETLEYYTDDIKEDILLYLASALFEHVYTIDNSSEFVALNARQRVCIIIANIMIKISDDEFDKFIDENRHCYSKLKILDDIRYWIEHNKELDSMIRDRRLSKLRKFMKEISMEIYNNNISLYDEFYYEHNIFGLTKILEELEIDIKFYIEKVLTSDNVIRFIFDMTNISHSSTGYHSYYIENERLDRLVNVEIIDKLISERDTNNEDDNFVLDIYNKFKSNREDEFGQRGIKCIREKNLVL